MKVEYLPSFLKDLKVLKSTPVFEQIKGLVFVFLQIWDAPRYIT
jgi:mRNA interferase RelE/StbE